jgi:hypothetical protein
VNVRFKVRGVEKIQNFLKELPRGTVRVALIAISEWMIGDSQSGLKHPEPYKYVARKKAYGVSFFSDKQRRYVMAKIRSGEIVPGQNNRTGASEDAWSYTPATAGKNYAYKLVNPTPGAYWTRDDKNQARQPAKVGWLKVGEVVRKNMSGAIRAAKAAVNDWIKQNG